MVGMLRTQSQGDRISVALRKLLQGGRRGCQAIYKFAAKGADSLNIKDQISSQGIYILYMRRCKPLGSLNSFLSYAPHLSGANPVSLFSLLLAFSQVLLLLAFLQLLSNLCGVGQHPLDEVLGGLIHTGDQKLLMAVTFLVY